jgi:hypothetical protein
MGTQFIVEEFDTSLLKVAYCALDVRRTLHRWSYNVAFVETFVYRSGATTP